MKKTPLFTLVVVVSLFCGGCSLIKPASEGTLETQSPVASRSPQTAATEASRLLPTCIPQPVGSCTTPNPDEPVEISGDIPYTSPFFINTISEPFVMLEDEAGFVFRDHEFRFTLESQVIGPVALDEEMEMSYSLSLPSVPQGTFVDVDNNGVDNLGLQVFAVAYWSNTWGDPFLEERDGKGWSTAYTSAVTDPENDNEIIGGTLVVWSPDDEQGFPNDFGPDGKLFTEDDPIETVLAGYTLVNLDSKPFRFYKESQPTLTLLEGAGAVKDFSKMQYSQAFEELYSRVSLEYPFTQEKQIDWDSLHDEFLPQIDRVQSDKEFYSLMRSFSYRIPDGHVNLSLDPELFYASYGGGYGITLERLSDQRVIVKHIVPNGPADRARILAGAEIASWNGEPINEAIAKVIPGFGSYSTEHTQNLAQVTFLTRTPPETQVELRFRNPESGRDQEARLKSVPEYDSLFVSLPGFNLDPVEMPIFAQTLEENGLAYIRINTFSDDYSLMAKLWDRYIQNMIDNEAPGVIIDLRSNSGGSLGIAMDFAGYFFDQELSLYENYYYSEVTNQFEATGYPTQIKPGPSYYQGLVAILVSPECVSACEGFAYAMQREDRSIIVGHYPTAGAFGEVGLGQYKLPGEYSIQFPTGRPQSSDGTIIIEGTGIIPDIQVPVTVESALGAADDVLKAAVDALIESIQ